MRTRLLVLLAPLLASLAAAQTPFPDVPDDHWAAEAVARIARQGIVLGFPDGGFHGHERLTRYETALVVDRLLNAVEGRTEALRAAAGDLAVLRARMDDLTAAADDLSARIARLDGDGAVAGRSLASGATAARVDALEAEVARLRSALEAAGLVVPDPGAPGPDGAPGAAGPAGDAGPPGPAADVAPGLPLAPGEDGVAPASGADGATAADAAREARFGVDAARPWRVALGTGFSADGMPVRVVAGHETLLGFAGLRASAEAGIDDDGLGDVALAAHLTRAFGGDRFGFRVGAGLGYRFDLGAPSPAFGPFLGAVLGAEVALSERWAIFAEGTVDWHVAPPAEPADDEGPADGPVEEAVPWSPVRPALVVGAAFRF